MMDTEKNRADFSDYDLSQLTPDNANTIALSRGATEHIIHHTPVLKFGQVILLISIPWLRFTL